MSGVVQQLPFRIRASTTAAEIRLPKPVGVGFRAVKSAEPHFATEGYMGIQQALPHKCHDHLADRSFGPPTGAPQCLIGGLMWEARSGPLLLPIIHSALSRLSAP